MSLTNSKRVFNLLKYFCIRSNQNILRPTDVKNERKKFCEFLEQKRCYVLKFDLCECSFNYTQENLGIFGCKTFQKTFLSEPIGTNLFVWFPFDVLINSFMFSRGILNRLQRIKSITLCEYFRKGTCTYPVRFIFGSRFSVEIILILCAEFRIVIKTLASSSLLVQLTNDILIILSFSGFFALRRAHSFLLSVAILKPSLGRKKGREYEREKSIFRKLATRRKFWRWSLEATLIDHSDESSEHPRENENIDGRQKGWVLED